MNNGSGLFLEAKKNALYLTSDIVLLFSLIEKKRSSGFLKPQK